MSSPRHFLQEIARVAMRERGFEPDFSPAAREQVAAIEKQLPTSNSQRPTSASRVPRKDLRDALWCSIDNDDSKDLDQLSAAQASPTGGVKILVAIADVDSLVERDTPIDQHAAHNTTSVYTGAEIFPMLPERLSTDLPSLNEDEDRTAIVIEYVVADDGTSATTYSMTIALRS